VRGRQATYKAIKKYDRHGKADFVSKIVFEIEKLGGRFLLCERSGQFILAPDSLKHSQSERFEKEGSVIVIILWGSVSREGY
jgi:hypothetical protein